MRTGWKTVLALGFVGAVAVAGTAVGQSGGPTTAPGGPERPRVEQRERKQQDGQKRRHGLRRRLVHGEFKVQTRDGFANVIVDTGEVTAIDHGAKTLTLKRADDETVTLTATETTRVRKDGDRSTFDAIREGDLVRVVQIDKGDGFAVRRIVARTPGSTPDAGPAADDASLSI